MQITKSSFQCPTTIGSIACYCGMIAAFALFASGGRADEGRIVIQVIDAHGDSLPARSWVDAGEHRFFTPVLDNLATVYEKDRSFSHEGRFTMLVPAGEVLIHVEKGKEYWPMDVTVHVAANETVEKKVVLERWINMPSEGWYSADMHVHFGHDNLRVLKQLALADDVHLIPAFSYWLRGEGESWNREWPSPIYATPISIDPAHWITRNNIEIERIYRNAPHGGTIGATFLFNLNRPLTADRYGFYYPTDARLCRKARRDSPDLVLDADKPTWAETVIGAALGQLHTIQVCHNQYARNSTEVGSYGMIGPLATGESNAAKGDGLFHRTNSVYYRLLNCGFRLGVSGGSAIGVKAMPTGFNRVYAKVNGPFTIEKMWTAIKNGQSFATTGPMIDLLLQNGQQQATMGGTISINSNAQTLKWTATASVRSIDKLEALQIVHNGRVIESDARFTTSQKGVIAKEITSELLPRQSGWIAARALYRAPDGLLRQAHTSPIYIMVDDQPIASAVDARYMIAWVARLIELAETDPNRFPDNVTKAHVLSDYVEAKKIYERIAESDRSTAGRN